MRFWGSASLVLAAATTFAFAQTCGAQTAGVVSTTPQSSVDRNGRKSNGRKSNGRKSNGRKSNGRKFNELTLAGLRPGRDKVSKAVLRFGPAACPSPDQRTFTWGLSEDARGLYLSVDVDKANVVQLVRVSHDGPDCILRGKNAPYGPRDWESGRGLAVDASASRVKQLFGAEDSRSPSTKGGQQLELLYYAFDWAGTDVPQVLEVLCSVGSEGKPGRVVEITLAAPSL